MARYRFGKSEDLKCLEGIEKFEINAQEGRVEVCYAAKISTQNIIVPVNIKVEGYVLSTGKGTYYEISNKQIQYRQLVGDLPDPLPKYELSSSEVIWGSFGIVLLPLVLIWIISSTLGFNPFDKSDSNTSQEASDLYAQKLNNLLLGFWEFTPFAEKKSVPVCLASKNEDGTINISYCCGTKEKPEPPASCYYRIEQDGKAYVKESNEVLDLNETEQLFAVIYTIISDLYGEFDGAEVMKKFMDNITKDCKGEE